MQCFVGPYAKTKKATFVRRIRKNRKEITLQKMHCVDPVRHVRVYY